MRPNTWRVCSENSCGTLVFGNTRCPEHRRQPDDTYRQNATARGYDHKWRTFRTAYITQHPHCAVIGCNRHTTDIDHIDNLGPLGPRGYDTTNLMPLCHQHHSAKTAATTWAHRLDKTKNISEKNRDDTDIPQG